jgi:hypothetical protein
VNNYAIYMHYYTLERKTMKAVLGNSGRGNPSVLLFLVRKNDMVEVNALDIEIGADERLDAFSLEGPVPSPGRADSGKS